MGDLLETRWKRYGKDRVYVRTHDDVDVGYVDLVARSVVARVPGFEDTLNDCLMRWCPEEPTDQSVDAVEPVAPGPDEHSPEGEPQTVATDLASNGAGMAARAKRRDVNAKAPVLNFMAR